MMHARARIDDGFPSGAGRLAGEYRLGAGYVVIPWPDATDIRAVAQHEHIHAALGLSTTAGLLHQTLKWLQDVDLRRYELWHKVLLQAVELSRGTHEAAATIGSLFMDGSFDRAAFDELPCEYRGWARPVLDVLGTGGGHELSVVSSAIAAYAMDDPLDCVLSSSWNQIRDTATSDLLLPRVDSRRDQLLAILSSRPDVLQAAYDAGSEVVGQNEWDAEKESFRSFVTSRRLGRFAVNQQVREILLRAAGKAIPAIGSRADALEVRWRPAESRLRAVLREADDALEGWSIAFDDDATQGPDPLWFRQQIPYPNAPLTGLRRVRGGADLRRTPDLVEITRIPAPSVISDKLTLAKGDIYTRYYRFAERAEDAVVQGNPFAWTAYSFGDSVKRAVGPLAGRCPFVLHCFPETAGEPAIPEGLGSSSVGTWLSRFDDTLLVRFTQSRRWQLAVLDWPTAGVSTAVFVDSAKPRARLVVVSDEVRYLLLDDAGRAGVKPVATPWGRGIVEALSRSFPFTVPGEGVSPVQARPDDRRSDRRRGWGRWLPGSD